VSSSTRSAGRTRETKETKISISIDLDAAGETNISTGISFFDHMLEQLARHGGISLQIEATGDLEVDTHHTVEDVGIVLGECFAAALGDKVGIARFSSRTIPLDEAAIAVALDLSGRPFLVYEVEFAPDTPGLGEPAYDPQLTEEFLRAFATAAGLTLHVRKLSGKNTHHVVEATYKGLARCLRDAVRIEGDQLPSTKGAL
jgi:imidazoleglycerol-phosphate dehydratase